MIVPALPALDARLLDEHRDAHLALGGDLESSAHESVRLYRLLQHRLLVESLGQVQPVRPGVQDQLLLPAPRAFLTSAGEARIIGAEAALRYVAGRVDGVRQRRGAAVLHQPSPYVLHSFFEMSMPSGVDHGAGLVRHTDMRLHGRSGPAPFPRAADCERLLDLAVGVVGDAVAPPIVRAAWLAFMVMTIHPFLDGNGRVARALFLATQAEDRVVGLDAGVMEQWSLSQSALIEAIGSGWSSSRWDPARIDALPFMTFATQASVVGAGLSRRRLRTLSILFERFVDHGSSTPIAELVVGVALLRVATPDELSPVLCDVDVGLTIESAISEGLVHWSSRPPSRRTAIRPDPLGLVVSPRARDMLA